MAAAISKAAEVEKRLQGGAPSGSDDATKPQDGTPNAEGQPADTGEPKGDDTPAAQPTVKSFGKLDVVVRGEKKTLDLDNLAGSEEGREFLRSQLQLAGNTESRLSEFDSTVERRAREHARDEMIRLDVKRGLIEEDPITGGYRETELGRMVREGREQSATKPSGDPLAFMAPGVRKEYQEAKRKGLEGDEEAALRADELLATATAAHARRVAEDRFRELEAANTRKAQQRETAEFVDHVMRTTNAEIDKHKAILRTPAEQQAARNMVAAAMQNNGGKFDRTVLGQVAAFAQLLQTRGASGGPTTNKPGGEKSKTPQAGARGSSIPPGPPKGAAGSGSPAAGGEGGKPPSRPRIGSREMVDAVTERLRSA